MQLWWGVAQGGSASQGVGGSHNHTNDNDNDNDDTYMTPLGRFDLQSRSAWKLLSNMPSNKITPNVAMLTLFSVKPHKYGNWNDRDSKGNAQHKSPASNVCSRGGGWPSHHHHAWQLGVKMLPKTFLGCSDTSWPEPPLWAALKLNCPMQLWMQWWQIHIYSSLFLPPRNSVLSRLMKKHDVTKWSREFSAR